MSATDNMKLTTKLSSNVAPQRSGIIRKHELWFKLLKPTIFNFPIPELGKNIPVLFAGVWQPLESIMKMLEFVQMKEKTLEYMYITVAM